MLQILMLAATLAADAPPRPAPSAFDGYRPFRADEPLADWRAVNDTVRDVGGHLGILRAGRPEPGKAATPANPAEANPHAGHGKAQSPAGPKR